MAYERRTYLYEILVRFGANGLKGSHCVDIEEVFDTLTGDVISSKELPARPITEAEVGAYLGTANAAALVSLTAREEVVTQKQAELEALRSRLAGAAASVLASA